MAYKTKTAREKLEANHGLPKVVDLPDKMQKTFGQGKMVIPAPLTVDALIRKVKKGKLVTPRLIRQALARDFKADVCCPLTTGIFIRICAEAAEEDLEAGRKKITPWWRVVMDDGSLIARFPGGTAAHARLLEKEGHELVTVKGKKRVNNFEKALPKK